MMRNLSTLGIRKLAVVYQNNELGRFMLPHVKDLAAQYTAVIVGNYPVNPDGANAKEAVQGVEAADPQGILLLVAGAAMLAFMRTRQASSRVPVYALSLAGTTAVIEKLGPAARGMAFTQVVPYPLRHTTPLSRRFAAAMDAARLPQTYDRMWATSTRASSSKSCAAAARIPRRRR